MLLKHSLVAAMAIALLAWAPAASAGVTVGFTAPEHYRDAGSSPGYGPDPLVLGAIEDHLQALGRCLPVGRRVEIEVLDLDRAGQLEWWGYGGYDLRVTRATTPPRVSVHYRVRDAAGGVLTQGRERITDVDYQSRVGLIRTGDQPFGYEKAMLGEWFEARFCPNIGP